MQLPAVAVIVKVVVCAVPVLFVRVPLMEDPVPLEGMPVRFPVLSLVQLKVVPATLFGLEIAILVIAVPEQAFCVTGVALTVGTGLTVTETVVVDEQLPAVAVIVKIVVWAVFVVFVSVPVMGVPVPLAAMPVKLAVLFRIQLNMVPAILFGLVITISVIAPPEQIVWVAGVALTVGPGLTVKLVAARQPGVTEHSA